jgi:hypothetical protein
VRKASRRQHKLAYKREKLEEIVQMGWSLIRWPACVAASTLWSPPLMRPRGRMVICRFHGSRSGIGAGTRWLSNTGGC